MIHNQKQITINNNSFMIDIELIDTITLLSKNRWTTSGCCIGDYNKEDSAWIIIQTTNEDDIIQLMQNLKECNYIITKRMYYKNSNDTLCIDYLFETIKCNYEERCQYINKINKSLSNIRPLDNYKINTIMSEMLG